MKTLRSVSIFLLLVSTVVEARYDSNWTQATTWPGESPFGFTMTRDETILIRNEPNQDAGRIVRCDLRAKATYHIWNWERTEADRLQFVTFTRKLVLTAKEDFDYHFESAGEPPTRVLKGEKMVYLSTGVEGSFRVEFRGESYVVDRSLLRHLEQGTKALDALKEDLWLGLRCANGVEGWIFIPEIRNRPGFGKPQIFEYGTAVDAN